MIPIFSLNKIYEDEDFVKNFREFLCISDKFFDLDLRKQLFDLYKMPSLFNLKEYGIEGCES